MDKKVWFVTGRNGLGSALITYLHAEGHHVASSEDADEKSAVEALHEAYAVHGRIDVFVNNTAGGGDSSLTDAALLRLLLPWMKAQRSGRILQLAPFTGIPHSMASQQVIHLAAALGAVTRPLGIPVTAVVPGIFSTNLPGASIGVPVQSTLYRSIDGRQIGDPMKAAAALLECAAMPEPPALLVLGIDAYRQAARAMKAMLKMQKIDIGMLEAAANGVDGQ